jgi:hypothetical protein
MLDRHEVGSSNLPRPTGCYQIDFRVALLFILTICLLMFSKFTCGMALNYRIPKNFLIFFNTLIILFSAYWEEFFLNPDFPQKKMCFFLEIHSQFEKTS